MRDASWLESDPCQIRWTLSGAKQGRADALFFPPLLYAQWDLLD